MTSSRSAAIRIQKPARGNAAVTGGGAGAAGAWGALEALASPMAGAAPGCGIELDIEAWVAGGSDADAGPGADAELRSNPGLGVGSGVGGRPGEGAAAEGVAPGPA